MAVKIYVAGKPEQEAAQAAITHLQNAFDYYVDADNDMDQEDAEVTSAFLSNVQVVIGTAQLDTALMGEIGKAYKEKYDQAVAAGDEVTKNKMIGAMFAVKKIMEMVSEPAY